MYMDFSIRIPEEAKGITRKKIKGVTYVYYAYERNYSSEKRYTVPKTTSIGKCDDSNPGMMFPNQNYLRFFPDTELPEEEGNPDRSGCLHIGAYAIIRQIISEYKLDKLTGEIFEKDGGLFLDLAAYSIIAENNAAQYYPDYAYDHPLFTPEMRIYSDSKISEFLGSYNAEQRIRFLNAWNQRKTKKEKIYISYDSTNKHTQAGDVELGEFGHEKVKEDKPIFNYAIAYDHNNSEPLFYEDYPGSINDVSQLQYMLEKANGYGYKDVGFILDRGYFSKANIHYMDRCGYEFLIMLKGMKDTVSELVLKKKGSFEQDRAYSIRSYKVNGITVPGKLYPSDERDRYFHIYYSEKKHTAEREVVEVRIDRMSEYLKAQKGTKVDLGPGFRKYFDLIYYHEGQSDQKFMFGRERTDVINREISLCGYFVLITSEKLTAAQALELYKSRDASEKLFRGDKSYLGNKSMRVYSNESTETKILVEFVALIIRNRIYTRLRDASKEIGKKENFMTVPAALRELEKIQVIRQTDGWYRLDHAVTARQKEILKAFGLTAANIKTLAADLNQSMLELAELNAKEMMP